MAKLSETGIIGYRGRGGRWVRRGLVTVGLAASLVAAGTGVTAQAGTGAGPARPAAACDQWGPATAERLTSNNLLGVYLQKKVPCFGGTNLFKVAVHNYSINAVGNRQYGLVGCVSGMPRDANLIDRWPAYIPAHGAWASPERSGNNGIVAGVIYRPRTSSTDPFVIEVATDCIA